MPIEGAVEISPACEMGRRRGQGNVEAAQAALRDANPEPLELSRAKPLWFCREQGISKQQTHAGCNSLS